MRTTLDLYPTPRSRAATPRQHATAACEPPDSLAPPEPPRPSFSMGQPSPRSYLGRGLYPRPVTAPVRPTPPKRDPSPSQGWLELTSQA